MKDESKSGISDLWGWLIGGAFGLWSINYFTAEIAMYWLVTAASVVTIFHCLIAFGDRMRHKPHLPAAAMESFNHAAFDWDAVCADLAQHGLVEGKVKVWLQSVSQKIVNFRAAAAGQMVDGSGASWLAESANQMTMLIRHELGVAKKMIPAGGKTAPEEEDEEETEEHDVKPIDEYAALASV